MIATVIGTRPQFIKASVVSPALQRAGISETLLHTGQHYDAEMSSSFFSDLALQPPFRILSSVKGNSTQRFAAMISGVDECLEALKPKAVLVYGDSDSAPAGAIAAVRKNIPVIHIEAGLRSHNFAMPEEWNRIITDRISAMLFCSSAASVQQLQQEGITKQVYNTGDVMYDALLQHSKQAAQKAVIPGEVQLAMQQPFVLLTLHRPYNVDDPAQLAAICNAVSALPVRVIWPVHPRTAAKLEQNRLPQNVLAIKPLGYFEMLLLLQHAEKVITDSGGLQKEAYWMGKPCITIRPETEWHELVEAGCNRLLPYPEKETLLEAFHWQPQSCVPGLYGDGDAATRIAGIIKQELAL